MRLPLGGVEHRTAKAVGIPRIGQLIAGFRARDAGKLSEKLAASLADGPVQLGFMVGEVQKRGRGGEFLPLEQHRDPGHQQQISRHRATPAGAGQRVQPRTGHRVGDLIVVLQEHDKGFGRQVESRGTARLLLPDITLALIEEAVFRGCHELARSAAVIAVIGLAPSGQRHHGAVMKIVVPQRVEPAAAALRRPREPGLLRLVLADHDRVSAASGLADLTGNRRHDVLVRGVEHLLGRVEAQPVEMIFLDPTPGVREDEFTNRPAIRPVEIDGLAPFVLVAVGEIAFREAFQVIPVRAEMVVDDVEDGGDAEPVGTVDKGAELVRATVETGRRERVDPVIPPAELAGKIRHRHQFETGDPQLGQSWQFAGRFLPVPIRRKGADMQLVNDQLLAATAAPPSIGPAERARIDDLRGAVRAVRLKT